MIGLLSRGLMGQQAPESLSLGGEAWLSLQENLGAPWSLEQDLGKTLTLAFMA